jgi:hypothetical protein
VRAEPEIPDDVVAKPADLVGGDGRADPRRELRCREEATRAIAALEDERPQPRLREVRGRDQSVVTGADDYGVVLPPRQLRPPSSSEASAAPATRRGGPRRP